MEISGGDVIGRVLKEQGVSHIFTLCGGHISPILTGSKGQGIRIIDVRHEANAVFAADAMARLTGIPGVAAVTAGPGVTNTVTAVKNAQMAQTPLVLLGGAAATVIRGRGSLQDIDQMILMRSVTKAAFRIKKNCDIVPVMRNAFATASSGVPGPVFVECPIDLLYSERIVRDMYGAKAGGSAGGLRNYIINLYLKRHVDRIFACSFDDAQPGSYRVSTPHPGERQVGRAAEILTGSEKPLLVIGSQAMLHPREADRLAAAVSDLGIPVYLTGMGRGLLGKGNQLQFRHRRGSALRRTDCLILAGMPCDFRLDYGRAINRRAHVISVNRSRKDLYLNIRPGLAIHGDPFLFLCSLAQCVSPKIRDRSSWIDERIKNESEREMEIESMAKGKTGRVNPLKLLKQVEGFLDERSIIVADGGDFVATASYVLNPRRPLSWLDPGVYGTLGVGAGFALGAALCRPGSEVWLVYGDGAAGYSIQEMDTFVRHGVPVIALIGNDAGWTQIARDQVTILNDDVATRLRYSDYHEVARGFGAEGLLIRRESDIAPVLRKARQLHRKGRPVLINALVGTTNFRKGSISM